MKTLMQYILSLSILISLHACQNTPPFPEDRAEVPTDIQNQLEAIKQVVPLTDGAHIFFPTVVFDAGEVEKGELIPYTFYFTNHGDEALVITNAEGSCGCTVPYYPKDPILPGETDKINVTVDTKRKTEGSLLNITVLVYSNAKEVPERLQIKGRIKGNPIE